MSTTAAAAAAMIGDWVLSVLMLTFGWGMGTKVTQCDGLRKAQ